jgi:S-adenosylmethionine:tRNA ribosyltransferase-isomerase
LKLSEFDYHLPLESIAQTPLEPRDTSRLLVLDRQKETLAHRVFRDLGDYLKPGDVLVLNETRVIPARIFARKLPGGGRAELLLLKQVEPLIWEVLVGGKGLKQGRRLEVGDGLMAEVVAVLSGPRRLVRFDHPVEPHLEAIGQMPLPPYIHTPLVDRERYQTVYSAEHGSAAAPTAGLHFTPELIEKLSGQGIQFARLVLHVGLDTFAPVVEDDPRQHTIHSEWCELSQAAAWRINSACQEGGRIVAVGTTSVRTLESAAQAALQQGYAGVVAPISGPTDLYILPGYQFLAVDSMITNFHLPRSTLLMLVSAFAGRERVLNAYKTARDLGYRFYSFGDAMLIL